MPIRICTRSSLTACIAGWLVCGLTAPSLLAETLELSLRYQQPTSEGSSRFHRLHRPEQWKASDTAVIVCDVWDSHHSVQAVRRVQELAPRIDQFVQRMRAWGAAVIHAPSECMPAYEEHPARHRAQQTPQASNYPPGIESWCDQIPSEQAVAYPLDQSDGGEDDDLQELAHWAQQLKAQGRKPRAPWLRQVDSIQIDGDLDFISDSGREIWNVLEARKITNVILVGVHTNMCVLGRPFGLRRLASAGKHVVLVRDLTDTMYDPRDWPFVSHFSGTDLIVDHIERYVCPTIDSSQILSGGEFRFSKDHRPQLTMVIAEDEYKTEETLPRFAAKHLGQSFRWTTAFGDDAERNKIMSLEDIKTADALLISIRRRWLPDHDLQQIRQFVASGKPMIGIRTASHAFSKRSEGPPSGYAEWPDFDAQVWGGNYTNHFGNRLQVQMEFAQQSQQTPNLQQNPILRSLGSSLDIQPGGSLYKTSPLAQGTDALLFGRVSTEALEPVAWTYVRADGGRSFYTSLGHPNDFSQPQFEALLSAGIHWACELPLPDLDSVQRQNTRYNAGAGRQR